MDSSSEEQNSSTRTPRRREGVSPRKRATRKKLDDEVVVKRKVPAPKPEIVEPTETRKAPTPFSLDKAIRRKKNKRLTITLGILFLGVGASAAVGFTDMDTIDVQRTIEERNLRIRNNNANENDVIISNVELPVQNTNTSQKADGGLKGRGTGGTPSAATLPESISSSTASTTDEVSSSTEESIEDVESPTTE